LVLKTTVGPPLCPTHRQRLASAWPTCAFKSLTANMRRQVSAGTAGSSMVVAALLSADRLLRSAWCSGSRFV